jgi:hypothetical protein
VKDQQQTEKEMKNTMNKNSEATFDKHNCLSSLLTKTLPICGALLSLAVTLPFTGCTDESMEAVGRGLSSGATGSSSGTTTSSTSAHLLHGHWQSFQSSNPNVKSIFLTLGADKKFEFAASLFKGAPQSSRGRYDVVGNRINLFPVGDVPEVMTFTLVAGTLTMTDKDRNWMKLRR